MADDRLNVLLVCANPRGSNPLRTAEEDRTLRESIQLSTHRSRIHVDTLQAATVDDVRRATLRSAYHIVHFSGHGTERGLVLEDADGRLMIPSSEALGELLHRRGVQTAIFNACYSLSTGHLAAAGVEYAVASSGPISDPAAIEFTRGFYDAIGEGLSVPEAFEEGLSAARLKDFRPDVVLLRRGDVHVGRPAAEPTAPAQSARVPVTVGVALDTSGSMQENIRNETGGALSRLEGTGRAIRRLGQSVQGELARSATNAGGTLDDFRFFAYAFGLRHRDVADLFALFRAAKASDVAAQIERRKEAYTREAEGRAERFGGVAKVARDAGFGGAVRRVEQAMRRQAERSIRERILHELADLLHHRAVSEGDVELTAAELATLLQEDGSNVTLEPLEALLYGSTPLRGAAQAVRARFERLPSLSDNEKRILLVISDGESTDGDPRDIFSDIREAGVIVVSCFVTDEDIADPRVLVTEPPPSWKPAERLMFDIASSFDEDEALTRQLLGKGWLLEPDAKLFVQVNHSEVLEEFVRTVGADVFDVGNALPEGR